MMEKTTITRRSAPQPTGDAPQRLDAWRLKTALAVRQAYMEIERLTEALGEAVAEKTAEGTKRRELERTVQRLRAEAARKDSRIRDLAFKVRRLEQDPSRRGDVPAPWTPLPSGCGRGYGLA